MSAAVAVRNERRLSSEHAAGQAKARTMRIIRIIARMNIGGPAVHVAHLSNGLDFAQFATTLVIGEGDSLEGDLSELVRCPPIELVRLRSLRRAVNPWRDLAALYRVFNLLRMRQPQIIHTHTAKAGTVGRLAGLLYNALGNGRRRNRRAVLIHTFHGHVLDGYFSASLTAFFVRIERWLARRTDCLIAVSPRVRDELLKLGIGHPQQWRVIPLGLDLDALSALPLANRQAVFRAGMVGRLVPIKNPHMFVDALEKAARRQPASAVSGTIVGDGPLHLPLEAELRQRGLESAVRLTGWQRDLPRVYAALDVVCLTSWNEGTPVALIEAMAAGRPVVATDVGGVRDLLDVARWAPENIAAGAFHVCEQGILVRPGDAEGLAAALQALAGDNELCARLGRAARAHVMSRFRSERLCKDMAALYFEQAEAKEVLVS